MNEIFKYIFIFVTYTCIINFFSFNIQLLFDWLIKEQQQLGGPGIIVEIDEAKIGKRKFNKDRILKGQ